jgi:4-oxalocrotonate tautomerase
MPIITVKYSTPRAQSGLKAKVASAASELSAGVLHKDPKITAVVAEAVDPSDWFCGGHSLAESGLASFWLEIRITEGSNTKDEKAAFIAAVFKRMGELLGPLHVESYVYANEVRADGYGFGGLTQERRYIAGKLVPRTRSSHTHEARDDANFGFKAAIDA